MFRIFIHPRVLSKHLCNPSINNSLIQNVRNGSMLAWKTRDGLNNSNHTSIRDKISLISCPIPIISAPNQLLIKIKATSINPLDYRMLYGYGRQVLDLMDIISNHEPRITNDRYPLTLGRDFSGEVVAVGPRTTFKVGDQVFGVIEPHRNGSHGQFVIANNCCISDKPQNISHVEAASIPFAALTCYSALKTFGGLSMENFRGKSILVVGGSGGVGSFAIQLLKLWEANVTATCSKEKIDWLENTLFVDKAIDHDNRSELELLASKFDFILDCGAYDDAKWSHRDRVGFWLQLLKPRQCARYVTLSPPLLNRIDKDGLILGVARSVAEATIDTIQGLQQFNSARWAFFMPNKKALDYIGKTLADGSITCHVSKVFPFNDAPLAYEELVSGQTKGKIVLDLEQSSGKDHDSSHNGHEDSSPL